jgi:hypothetical protein
MRKREPYVGVFHHGVFIFWGFLLIAGVPGVIPSAQADNFSFKTINYPGAVFPGTDLSGIDDFGQIVGTGWTGTGEHGFSYSSGIFTPITPEGSVFSVANGISDSGRYVVGQYGTPSGAALGFLDTAGSFRTIQFPRAAFTSAQGVNNSGEIVGFYSLTPGGSEEGFLDTNGHFRPITIKGATDVEALGINDSGEIVGWYRSVSGVRFGFLDKNGVVTTIDVFDAPVTVVTGIDDFGELVGWYIAAGSRAAQGFISSDGTYSTLDFRGAANTSILGVNNPGLVVGAYDLATGPHTVGVDNGFLAIPPHPRTVVPEPSAFQLWLIAAFVLLLGYRYHEKKKKLYGRVAARNP